ncbi:MAG: tRNA pseudouridine(55) synthase TruB [Candidatus Saccharibacteria bacterium]
MNGILLVDKPKGWTSFDVVGKIRYMVQHSELNTSNKKRFPTGHTGTLDPLATGLLVVLLGASTKQAMNLTKLDKTYEVTMKLGQTSTTGDAEGTVTSVNDSQPTEAEITEVLQQFVGDIMQTPPAFSAIKINGQRAYKLAREGKIPDLKPRPVHINSIMLTEYAYPYVRFIADVSSGTYIRSLVEDAGAALKTGAYMSDLRRTRVGEFDIKDAVIMDGLTPQKIADAKKDPSEHLAQADPI